MLSLSLDMIYYPYMNNNDKELAKLGERLRNARKLVELTQSQVAKKAGINVNYYARIERGEINASYENLQSIAKALNIKMLDVT